MTRAEILEKLEEIFIDLLDNDDFKLEEGATMETVAGWDSLLHITLMASVECDFGIHLSTDDISHGKNVKTLVDIIERELSKN